MRLAMLADWRDRGGARRVGYGRRHERGKLAGQVLLARAEVNVDTVDDDENEDERRMRDDVRSQTTARMVEDALWRFNEEHEDTLSVYDVLSMVVEDLVKEGMCAACINESIAEAF